MQSKRIHYFSGIILTAFIGIHLFNHLTSWLGIEEHIQTMKTLRIFYRNPFFEVLLFLLLGIQIFSGILNWKTKRKQTLHLFEKIQGYSGLYLIFFLFIHVNAVLSGRYFLKVDTNFYFASAGLNTFPFTLFFIPYYALAIMSFFGHLAGIHAQKMKYRILNLSVTQQAWGILILGFVTTVLILWGFTNGFQGIATPLNYQLKF